MIPVFRPCMGQDESYAVRQVIESGWIGLGPKTAEFERKFAEYVGAKYAVAVNSATAALHLSLVASEVGPGDDVIVPTMTFVSTAHAVCYTGARPVFCDVDPATLNIDINSARKLVTDRTKAIIPVHFGGYACDMHEVWKLAKEYDLHVVEDAAHACGGGYNGKKIGGRGGSDFVCFSFHAVKNMSTGDGGMITTWSGYWAKQLAELRWCGIDKSTWERLDSEQRYGWEYDVKGLGYKYHMNDIAAAIGLVQLRKLDAMNARRNEIADTYNGAFADLLWLKTPVRQSHISKSACHNYVIKTHRRNDLYRFLRGQGISSGVHYRPVHLFPMYRTRRKLPVAEVVWKQLLTLPLFPDMTCEEVAQVVSAVREFGEKNGLNTEERII